MIYSVFENSSPSCTTECVWDLYFIRRLMYYYCWKLKSRPFFVRNYGFVNLCLSFFLKFYLFIFCVIGDLLNPFPVMCNVDFIFVFSLFYCVINSEILIPNYSKYDRCIFINCGTLEAVENFIFLLYFFSTCFLSLEVLFSYIISFSIRIILSAYFIVMRGT